MTSKITLFIFMILITSIGTAQTPGAPSVSEPFIFNPEKTPCLTPEQRSDMILDVHASIKKLQRENRLSFSEQRRGSHPLFIWPVQKASNVTFNDVWGISNYVDHDETFPDQLEDYNCGTTTYDTTGGYNHQGVDIFSWPFAWKLMDDDGVEIIAAAPGQIIFKRDGEFDRNCSFNSDPWNAVYVQHSDGSVALYGHMKNGSTTSKIVGDMVTAGEYLGIVGSSGSSSGPHLHFEVYESVVDGFLTGLIDPYSGSCNNMNPDSWWAVQKPYKNPKINAVLTHSQVPDVFPPCPTSETTYISNDFQTDDGISFAFYLRDQTVGDNVFLEIIRPDNSSLFPGWNITVGTTWPFWNYAWGPWTGYFDMVGEWKWRITFAGETVTHTFNVSSALSVDENDFSQTSVYPNPFNDVVNISSTKKIIKANVVDVLGKSVLSLNESSDGITSINLSNLSNGMYFLLLESDGNERKTIKLIKD